MSENQPPNGPWQPGQNQGGQGWQQGPYPPGQGWQQADAVPPQPPKRRRLGVVLGGVGAAAALVIAGGSVFAWQQLSGGGPQPAEALPGSSLGYVRVDLDPSASQKVNIIRLLRRVPEFTESTGIDADSDDLRKAFFEKALAESDCDVTYGDDIEPWIGERAAVAAVPGDDEPDPVFAIQSSDEDAAKKGIEKLADCGGSDDVGVAFVGDYALVAEDQQIADDAASAAEDAPLSDNEAFRSDMDALGDQGVVSAWFNGDLLSQVSGALPMGATNPVDGAEGLRSGALALRAGSDYIELAGVAHQDSPLETEQRSDVADLPESTVFAASVAGGGDYAEQAWSAFTDAMGSTMYDFDAQLEQFEQSTGLSLPGDLQTALGKNLTVAVDSEGLGAVTGAAGPDALSQVGIGVKMTTDTSAAQDLLRRVNDGMTAQGGPELATKETDDGLVVATNDGYAAELAEDGSLGDSDTFTTVVPDADDAVGVLYLDVDEVTEVAKSSGMQDSGFNELLEQVDPIEAVGLSAANGDDGRNTTLLRVSFD